MSKAYCRVCIQIHKAQTIKHTYCKLLYQLLINNVKPNNNTFQKYFSDQNPYDKSISLSGVFSVWVLEAAAFLFRATVAEPDHDALQTRLHNTKQGPLGRVTVPAGLHQLPAFLIKTGQPLWSGTWRWHGCKWGPDSQKQITVCPQVVSFFIWLTH